MSAAGPDKDIAPCREEGLGMCELSCLARSLAVMPTLFFDLLLLRGQ